MFWQLTWVKCSYSTISVLVSFAIEPTLQLPREPNAKWYANVSFVNIGNPRTSWAGPEATSDGERCCIDKVCIHSWSVVDCKLSYAVRFTRELSRHTFSRSLLNSSLTTVFQPLWDIILLTSSLKTTTKTKWMMHLQGKRSPRSEERGRARPVAWAAQSTRRKIQIASKSATQCLRH